MPDDNLINIYISLTEDEISKKIIELINQYELQDDEDFETILEECLDVL